MVIGTIISICIAAISLILTATSFFFYDKKLKKLDASIKAIQLRQLKEAEDSEKKASIMANVIRGDNGKRTLKIFNRGKADAYNVNIHFSDESIANILMLGLDERFPYEKLSPQDSTSIVMFLVNTSPDTLKVKFTWDDILKKGNEYEQILSLD